MPTAPDNHDAHDYAERIPRGDGTFVNLWSSAKDTKTSEVKNEAFTDITVTTRAAE